MDAETICKSFLAGGIAGMTSKTSIAPLDRVKILLQAQNERYKSCGPISGMSRVVQDEGFLGLYKGNGAMMIRVFPYASIQFVSFDLYKKALSPFFHKDSQLFNLFAGSAAGLNAVILTYPLDLVRARLAFAVKPVAGSVAAGPTGVFATLVHIAKTEGGVPALYRGLTPTIWYIIPKSGLNFYCYEKVKNSLIQAYPTVFGTSKNNELVLSVPGKLMAGAVAGSIGQTVAYPLEVCRRVMQLSPMTGDGAAGKKVGMMETLVKVYQKHGIANGLFRGMTVNYVKTAPLIAINFAVYEMMKQQLGLQTGVDIKTD